MLVECNCNTHACRPWVSLTGILLILSLANRHMCWFSVIYMYLNMCDGKPGSNTWLMFVDTSTDMPAELVPFNQTCLLDHWKPKRKTTRPMPLDLKGQITETLLGMAVATLPMQQLCLLVHCHSVQRAIISLQLKKHTCWSSVTATNTSAVQTRLPVECCKVDAYRCHSISNCLSIFCHSTRDACWCGASLSAMPVSISAMPAGVVS